MIGLRFNLRAVLFCLFLFCATAQPPSLVGRGFPFLLPIAPPNLFNLQTSTIDDTHPECAVLSVRTLSGRCTSAIDPSLGEARRAQMSYLDVDSTTFSDDGLKSARVVSNAVADQRGDVPNFSRINELFVFFGQFVDHDLVSTPVSDDQVPIEVPADDGILSQSNLAFHRSLRQRVSTTSSKERPISVVSSALDLSMVYGVDEDRNNALRESSSCRLKTSEGDFLPYNKGGFTNSPSSSASFYLAGDTRVNEHPMLTVLHTLFVREHNYICSQLQSVTSLQSRSASELYETARAINIAQFQKIVYEEWLPVMLGRNAVRRYRGYQPQVDPTVSVEFSTAGFRVGHTMVGNSISRVDAFGVRMTPISMQDMFFRKSDMKAGDVENFLRGAMRTRAQQVDTKTVDALRNFLFSNVGEEEGIDLIALNLQRSRDHNVPRYAQLRLHLTGQRTNSFQDISGDRSTQSMLQNAYDDVQHVEAWVGLMAEDTSFSSPMGRTNTELWRREFERLRDGDRWFYLDEERHGAIGREVLDALPLLRAGIFTGVPLFGQIMRRNTQLGVFDVRAGALFRA
eukprot:TRINITY_DN8326_c0_g1_i1.p1 TRINITY_DN8326_c0_g1~~TRINITY_DN8326_c0_g1_i1.p1  ORF type:complete len:569 (-),score=92.13 TRINITY_DN8326_c0_g1_i1:370-2076(-)